MRITAGIVALTCTAALGLSHSVSARAAHHHSATSAHHSVSAAPTAAHDTDAYAQARKAFLEAYAHVPLDKPDAAAHDSELLQSYPLYPYLEAARVRQALSTETGAVGPADQRAEDFLIAYPDIPVSSTLRHAWLDSLAHRQQWNAFMRVYRDTSNETIRCESFSARINLGKTDGLTSEISSAWMTPHSLPECDTAFTWLRQNGVLTPELIEKRARLALRDGNPAFASQIIAQLPPDRAAPLTQWVDLLETSEQAIDTLIASPQTAVEPEALLAGWTRFARMDPEDAKARYAHLVQARGLTTREAASPYALALALALAWDRDSDALQYFDLVAPKDMDDSAREWQARAALWAKAWDVAANTIASMSKSLQQSARWRYWAARTDEKLGETAEAQRLYESLLSEDDYYAGMAAARLKRPVVPHPKPLPEQPQVLRRLARMPGMLRARELFLCNMRPEALAEWQDAYESLSEPARQQAIHLAASWGWYDQAVTVAATQHIYNDYDLLYPRPYGAEVKAAAHAAQLSPEIVYGVMRQESLYRVDAVSAAGARGLMQLEPSTARRTARHTRRALPTIADLFLPSVNTTLGAARLRMLLDQFGGQISLALAGYNAGVHAVLRWLPPQQIDSDIWIENIPYNETRGYVQRVLWHSLLFTWLRRHVAQRTTSWLAPIKPIHIEGVEDRVASSTRPPRT